MLAYLVAAAAVLGSIEGAQPEIEPRFESQIKRASERSLSDREREQVVTKIKFAIKKTYFYLDKAQDEAEQITSVRTRELVIAAIGGAVVGVRGKSPWSIGIGAGLAVLHSQVTNSTRHYLQSRDYLKEAQAYAKHADYLQNILLLGEWQ